MSLKRDIEFVLPLVINLQLAKLSADLKPSQGNNCCAAVCRGGGTLLGAHKKNHVAFSSLKINFQFFPGYIYSLEKRS